jgi:acetolactate synthase I/III small subunit
MTTLAAKQTIAHTVLELDVNNHAGVLSHVVGLFARRAYNLDGILVMPVGDATRSRVWVRVLEDARLEQMMKQLEKLEDVLAVRRHGAERQVFERIEELFGQESGSRLARGDCTDKALLRRKSE